MRAVYLIASKKQRFISPQISSKRRVLPQCATPFISSIASRLLFGRGLCIFLCIAFGPEQHKSHTFPALNTHELALFFCFFPENRRIFLFHKFSPFFGCLLHQLYYYASSSCSFNLKRFANHTILIRIQKRK